MAGGRRREEKWQCEAGNVGEQATSRAFKHHTGFVIGIQECEATALGIVISPIHLGSAKTRDFRGSRRATQQEEKLPVAVQESDPAAGLIATPSEFESPTRWLTQWSQSFWPALTPCWSTLVYLVSSDLLKRSTVLSDPSVRDKGGLVETQSAVFVRRAHANG
jgi:hypothetical protein